MMDDKYDSDKLDDIMLPGFRFHPTDEELVGFYLKRKIQQRPLSIELIKQLDIYKYDPWDLPKLSTTGEKEWYFYCPRDRKYRNSARPNRVTGAGFWKATGTDRPIYSSEGTKCIGLKKSLVFYTGRAAKGVKTDWMMHEFRLPSLTNPATPKRFTDKTLPVNDSWAICRIFKKTNSMAQRALSHSWVSPIPELNGSQITNKNTNYTHFRKESISCLSEAGSTIQFSCNDNDLQQCSPTSFSAINIPSYKPDINPTMCKQSQHPTFNGDLSSNFMFSSLDMAGNAKYTADIASMLLNFPPALLGDTDDCPDDINFSGTQQEYGGFSTMLPQEMQGNISFGEDEEAWLKRTTSTLSGNDQWGTVRPVDFPFNLPTSNLTWDSLPCPSDISTSYSTNQCYT